MKKLHTQEQIDEMRKRLYARDTATKQQERHQLTDEPVAVSRDWATPRKKKAAPTSDLRTGMDTAGTTEPPAEPPVTPPVATETPKRRYRTFVLMGSLLIFIFVAVASSLFVYFGGNQISNENIHIVVQGPSLVGGGEVVPLQIAVSNQNAVAIESATLILKYPVGTRSVGDSPRNLFEERVPLSDIAPGEIQTVPIQVALFGEENAERAIEATVEYRINGSNGMFYKDAEPLALRISSSPLVLRVDSLEKVASGQEVEVTLTAVSNASSVLEDILITASYPNGFSFQSAEPEPVYGQNVWRIDELLPEQSETVVLRGVIKGVTEENFRINFEAGPANPDNQYLVGSTLTETHTDFIIERPFIDMAVSINGKQDQVVVVPEAENSQVLVEITNTLDETVYDMVIEVVPGGNALDENSISSNSGFYDSNTGAVRWEVSNNDTFSQVLPGSKRTLEFTVVPGPNRTTASFDLEVNVYARRVAESSAVETLIGNDTVEGKYSASVFLGSQVGRNVGRFGDSGPVPPQAGESTTYTLTVAAEAGANDVTDMVAEMSLPVYVDWLDTYDAIGEVIYNAVSKELQWVIGNLSSGERRELTFQVRIKPSTSQVGQIPVLLNGQRVQANDRFTGTRLQDESPAVTTELSTEMGYERENGKVIR